MTDGIANKVILITGGSTGIGAETARLLASRGAKVAIAARRKDKLDTVVAEIAAEGGGEARAYTLDVTSGNGGSRCCCRFRPAGRAHQQCRADADPPHGGVPALTAGDLQINLLERTITKAGREVHLTS